MAKPEFKRRREQLKRGFQRGLSLFIVTIMLTSSIPMGVMAEEMTAAANEAVVNQDSETPDNQEGLDTNTSINSVQDTEGSANAPEIVQTLADPAIPEVPQNSVTTEALQISDVETDYQYEDIDGGVSITGYTGVGGDMVIPSTLDGKPVLEIGSNAFWWCNSLTSITLPEGLTSIGGYAFSWCGQLSRIDIPASVTTIGRSVFQGSNLVTIYGETGSAAETYAESNSISFIDSNSVYVMSFTMDKASAQTINTAIQLTAEGTNGKAPYQYKFYYKLGTETLTIRDYSATAAATFKPTKAGTYTLCVDVKDEDGNVATRNINDYMITETDFETTDIDGGVSIIGYHGSGGDLIVPSTLSGKKVLAIGDYTFNNCTNLTSISLPDGITSIGRGAFQSCSNLTNITVPKSVTSISDWAFNNCNNLTSISLPEGLTSIGSYAFQSCNSLTTISLSGSVTSIGGYAFSWCGQLSRIDIPASVTMIGSSVFQGSNLVTIYGVTGSAVETYAKANSISFIDSTSVYVMIFTTDKASAQTMNTNIQLTAEGTNGKTPYQYKFYYKLGTETVTIRDYSATAAATFKPTKAGIYTLCVDVKDAEGKIATRNINDYMITETDFETTDIDGGVSIIGYHGSGGDLIVPSTLSGKKVLAIGDYTFNNCTNLTSISLPDGITSIGRGAFQSCSNLTNITVPKSVTSISDWAFNNCNNLTSISLPEGLISIGSYAFGSCNSLTTISLSNSVTSIGDYAFSWCGQLSRIDIPASVTTIGSNVFQGNNLVIIYGGTGSNAETYAKVNNIQFIDSSSVCVMSFTTDKASAQTMNTNIQLTAEGTNGKTPYQYKFYYKLGTETLIIRDYSTTSTAAFKPTKAGIYTLCVDVKDAAGKVGTKYIKDYMITETDFETTVIDGGVSISGYHGNDGNVVVPSTLGDKKVLGIKSYAFQSRSGVTSISLPEGLISIGDSAFSYCRNLTSINIPKSVTVIGVNPFRYCTSLKSVTLSADNSSYTILDGLLLNKAENKVIACLSSLAAVSIPEGVTNIGDYTFSWCQNLESISVPKSVTSIGNNVFASSRKLTSIAVAAGNENYKSMDGVLYNKAGTILIAWPGGLTATDIPASVTSIGNGAFIYYGLTSIKLPESITSIGTDAFLNSSLTSIDIPESVTSISDYAFAYSYQLSKVVIPASVTTIGPRVFVRSDMVTIYGVSGSYAESYAKAHNISFVNSGASSLGVKSFDADKASGQYVNTSITLTAAGADGITPYQYKFYYKTGTTTITLQDYSAKATATFTPTTAGSYTLYVDVKDTGGKIATKNIENYQVVNIPNPSVSSFSADKASGQGINTSIQLSATGTEGKTPYQYKFYYKLGTATVTIKNFASANTVTFKPTKAGSYTLWVDVKDATGKIGSASIADYTVIGDPSVKTFTTDKASGQTTNTDINLTATGADGKTPYEYKFSYKLGTKTFSIQDFSAMNTATFKPTTSGTYTLIVDVKDANGKVSTNSITSYKVVNSLGVKSFIADKTSGQGVDTNIKLTATGSDGKTPYQYRFGFKLGSTITMIKDFSTTNAATFKPTTIGDYNLFVTIKDANGNTVTKNIDSFSIVPNPSVSSFTTDKVSGQGINTSIQLSATGIDGKTPYQYKFYYKLGTSTVTIKNFASANTATFKPIKAGSYTLWVDIKDATGKIGSASIANYNVYGNPSVKSFTTDKATGQSTNTDIKMTAVGVDGKNPYQYQFYYKIGTETTAIRGYTAENTAVFKPTKAGIYTLFVDVKDANGITSTKSITKYSVINTPYVKSFTTDKASGQTINTSIKLIAAGVDGKTPYKYKFTYAQGGTTVTIKDFSATSSVTFKPTKVGTYTLNVELKDANGKTSTKSIEGYVIK